MQPKIKSLAPGAGHQHTDQDAQTESNSHSLIWVLPNCFVRGFSRSGGLVLQALANFLCFVDGSLETGPKLTFLVLEAIGFVHWYSFFYRFTFAQLVQVRNIHLKRVSARALGESFGKRQKCSFFQPGEHSVVKCLPWISLCGDEDVPALLRMVRAAGFEPAIQTTPPQFTEISLKTHSATLIDMGVVMTML